jgi:hypothetical protein
MFISYLILALDNNIHFSLIILYYMYIIIIYFVYLQSREQDLDVRGSSEMGNSRPRGHTRAQRGQ